MSFISPQTCVDCCPSTFVGFCLSDGSPISLTLENGMTLGWTNLLTGVFTLGPPPAGTQICSGGGSFPAEVEVKNDVGNPVPVSFASLPNSAITIVPPSVVSVQLLPVDPLRKNAILYNDSLQHCYVKFGLGASNTSFSIRILGSTFYELNNGYTGVVEGSWQAVNGVGMRITILS